MPVNTASGTAVSGGIVVPLEVVIPVSTTGGTCPGILGDEPFGDMC